MKTKPSYNIHVGYLEALLVSSIATVRSLGNVLSLTVRMCKSWEVGLVDTLEPLKHCFTQLKLKQVIL